MNTPHPKPPTPLASSLGLHPGLTWARDCAGGFIGCVAVRGVLATHLGHRPGTCGKQGSVGGADLPSARAGKGGLAGDDPAAGARLPPIPARPPTNLLVVQAVPFFLAPPGSRRGACHARLPRAPPPRGHAAPWCPPSTPSPLTLAVLPFRRQLEPRAPFLLPFLPSAPSLLPCSPLPSPLPWPTLSPPPPRLLRRTPTTSLPPRPAQRCLGRTRLSAGHCGQSPHRKLAPRVSSALAELGPSLPKSLPTSPSAPRGCRGGCAFSFSSPKLFKSFRNVKRTRERNHCEHNNF